MGLGQRFEPGEIRTLREGMDMSPERFADTICRSLEAQGLEAPKLRGMTVRRWESGERVPNARSLEAISRAFGIPVGRFFVDCD